MWTGITDTGQYGPTWDVVVKLVLPWGGPRGLRDSFLSGVNDIAIGNTCRSETRDGYQTSHTSGGRRMKPAGIRYVTLFGIFLLATAVAWTSLLEARGSTVSASRVMASARLFEQQGRVLKAAELYRQVLRANPAHREAAYRLSRMRSNAAALLASTEPKKAIPETGVVQAAAEAPKKTTRVATEATVHPKVVRNAPPKPKARQAANTDGVATLNATGKDQAGGASEEPKADAVETKQDQRKSLADRLSTSLKSLRPEKTAPATAAATSEVKGGNEATAVTASGEGPKQVLPKTRAALGELKGKLTGVLPKRAVRQTATYKSPEEETPAETTVASDEAKTAAAPVESRESVGVRLNAKAKSIRGKISDAIDGVKPQLRRARKGDSNSAGKEKSNTEEPRKLNPVDPLKIVSKTKAALNTLRERLKTETKSSSTSRKQGAKTPLWSRVKDALRRSRANVTDRIGAKPIADAVAVETPETKADAKPAEEKPATASTEGNTAKPEKTSRPAVIPEMTTSDRILSASRTLNENAKDEAARKVLIEAVEFAPDVEASLAAYMLGSCGSGHPDVMVALGQQMSVRTGFARVHMCEAMLRLDGNHVAATTSLVGLSSSKEPEIRMMAAFAMQSATSGERLRCISNLMTVLKDEDADVRAAAALTLGGYGSMAKAAIPELVRMIHDENVDTARAAGVALQCIASPPSAIQPVAAEAVKAK